MLKWTMGSVCTVDTMLYTAQDRTRIFSQCDFHTEGKMVVVRSVACWRNISSNKITLRTIRGGALERSVEL